MIFFENPDIIGILNFISQNIVVWWPSLFHAPTGFHRPLRVVPPTASPQPPSYTARTPYFPSHFFPEKLHQYWQYYYPRIPGTWIFSNKNLFYVSKKLIFTEMYRRTPGEYNIYTSLYDPDRSKSANPNVYFYKTAGYPTGFIY